MKVQIPEKVSEIIEVLQQNGYDAYAVGGCIRDSFMGREPNDWDITTSAKPLEVKRLFRQTVDTGLQHGTVTVMIAKEGFEVTTYRIDGEYEDSRHPKEVTFTGELREDLKRRDFTINAMAYNDRDGLVDAFGGIEDMDKKVIRCVGNPTERFTEDALRILRAVRFSAQLGFSIEEETMKAAKELAPTLSKISAERIATELIKLLVSDHPDYLEAAYENDITAVILPEFDTLMRTEQHTPHHCYTVGKHTLESMKYIPADKILRLTMLLHDMGKAEVKTTDENGRDHFKGHSIESERIAVEIMRRLKLDNDTIGKVKKLVYWHDYRPLPNPKAVRRAVNKVGTDLFPLLLKVQYADAMAQSDYRREEKLERICQVEKVFKEIQEKEECVSVSMLAVNGKDLIQSGMKPGKAIGETLAYLLDVVLDEPEKNEKEYLLSLTAKRLEETEQP